MRDDSPDALRKRLFDLAGGADPLRGAPEAERDSKARRACELLRRYGNRIAGIDPRVADKLRTLVVGGGRAADACALVRQHRNRLTFSVVPIEVPVGETVIALRKWADEDKTGERWLRLIERYGLRPDMSRGPTGRCDACGQVIATNRPIHVWSRRDPPAVTHLGCCPEDPLAALERLAREL